MSGELFLAVAIGVLGGCGLWLMLRARTFDLVLGLTLLSYAVNLFLFASGRLVANAPAFVGAGPPPAPVADPLPQALVLTAIVIGFAMTALLLAIALAARAETGTDHVDGAPGHGRDDDAVQDDDLAQDDGREARR